MSATTSSLQRRIQSASDLKAVVITMKAIALTSIGQYQDSLRAQQDYLHSVELGLLVGLRQTPVAVFNTMAAAPNATKAAVIFGSDQGMVGQFNESLADYAMQALNSLSGAVRIWSVGERMQSRLREHGQSLQGSFVLPGAIRGIGPLATAILSVLAEQFAAGVISEVHVFHNRPMDNGRVEAHTLRLLPLDERWSADILSGSWPGKCLPEVLGNRPSALLHFVHEYLFMTLFRACAESLASENASRLAAMHRAEKNIGEMLGEMRQKFHQLRQSSIDEELFDQVSGATALDQEPSDGAAT